MSDPRFRGHCFSCGEACFDVLRRAPREDALAGEPLQLGRPHEDAIRADLILVSGRRMSVTLHEKCLDYVNLPKLWKNVIGAFTYEEDTRAHRNVRRSGAQQRAVDDFIANLVNDVPLGILSVDRWTEIPL